MKLIPRLLSKAMMRNKGNGAQTVHLYIRQRGIISQTKRKSDYDVNVLTVVLVVVVVVVVVVAGTFN